MKLYHSHPWDLTTQAAKEIQTSLRWQVIKTNNLPENIKYVAGADVGFKEKYKFTQAAIAVLSLPNLTLVDKATAILPTKFPYVPGFLSFREIPAIIAALEKITTFPQLILCDGQGLAHPRRFGLACHLGVLLDLPTIGVAKSLLIGKHAPVGEEKGDWQPLYDKGEIIGAALRSRSKVKPIYVSIGHRIDLTTAIKYTLLCTTKYRLPETTRWADKLASG
ncbi:MAG: deoxyribonuclease V [Cyanobacteria bacterium J083]|nr:MAG: deoxyribonuclease V [Cyanobacteria bacterium J083]